MNPHSFPEHIIAEANAIHISESLLSGRERVEGITIDGPASLDLDDAIFLEYSQDTFVVHVSIADVAACVSPGSRLFEEALHRTATRYLPQGNIPMLPVSISENTLSLLEQQPRPAITFSITLSRDLEIQKTDIRATVLKNRRRLNYALVDYLIDSCPDDPDYQLLNDCYILARRLMDNRRKRGALVIYDLQQLLFTNEEGQIVKMSDDDAHKSNIIVQEFMILTNMAVAELAAEREYVFLFRNHTARQTTPDRNEILEQMSLALHNPRLLDSLTRRSTLWFHKAKYEPALKGHYGLNLPAYTHITSPLRRAADLINHELLKAQMWGRTPAFSIEQLQEISSEINSASASEQKKKYFQEQTRKETAAHLARASADALARMEPDQFKRLLKETCRTGSCSEEFECAIMKRFAEKTMGVELLALLLFDAPANSERWIRLKAHALETALASPGFSNQLLHLHMQSGRLSGFRIEIREHNSGYAARVIAHIDDLEERSTPLFALHNSKKEAAHAAANEFLRLYLEHKLVPASSTVIPATQPQVHVPQETEEEKTVEENYVGKLGELCINRKSRSMPLYEFTQTGPSHAPVITCVCTLKLDTEIQQTTGVSSNKKLAKQLAAKKMFEETERYVLQQLVEHGIGGTSEEKTQEATAENFLGEENYVGRLNDLCAACGWNMPVFQFTHAGPSHKPMFTCKATVTASGEIFSAVVEASNKKNAKQLAAREILKQIE